MAVRRTLWQALVTCIAWHCAVAYGGDRVLLGDVKVSGSWCNGGKTAYRKCNMKDGSQSIMLHAGSMTTGRRSRPVPQLECKLNCDGAPDVVQCINVGGDGYNVNWKCEAGSCHCRNRS